MKTLIWVFTSINIFASVFAKGQETTQHFKIKQFLNGKRYYALISELSNELTSGGVEMSYTHCFLKFNHDTVKVAYYSDSNREFTDTIQNAFKSYQYSINKNKIIIGKKNEIYYMNLLFKLSKGSPNVASIYDYQTTYKISVYFNEVK